VDELGVVKCLECAHIGFNRKLKGKKHVKPEGAEMTGGLGIGDITYANSESEESNHEDEEDDEGGVRRVYRGRGRKKKVKKTFSTWGAIKKPEPEPPKKLSNDLRVTEELNTIYIFHNDDGSGPTTVNPNAKEEDDVAAEKS